MKYLYILMACAAIMAGCRNGQRNGAADSGTDTHAHTGECTGDHDHSSHAGHDHSTHDHAAEPHVHEDGTPCTGDHTEHDHNAHTGHDHSHEGHSHAEAAPATAHADVDEIIFTRAQAARTDFEVQQVVAGEFAEVIKASGQILPAPGDEVSVVAPAAGIVSFAATKLTDGTQVGRGQRLFYISSKNIASGDILARNAAAYQKAKSDFERAEKLLADKIVSQREYDDAKLAFEQAKAEYQALAGAGSSQGVAVTAPISGYVSSFDVAEGQYVETGQLLATVSQNRTLALRAEVSQRYLPRLRNITGANFTVPYDNTTYRLADHGGKLLSVSRNVTAGTTLLPVTFQFNNSAAVVPGSYVEVSLLGAPEHNVVTLPLTAVTEQQGLYYVYVQLDAEGYERREVKPGPDDGVRVKILSGIRPGERVVTRGAVNVKMAASSGSIPHTHEH